MKTQSVYLLPPSLVHRAQPLFAAQTYDQPFRDAVFAGTITAPLVVDDPVSPSSAVLCHPFYFFLGGEVAPSVRAFLKDAPQEGGVFTRYYAYATDNPDWRDALTADHPEFMVLDRRDFKWPDGKPAPEWRSRLPQGATLAWMDGAMAARVDQELNEHVAANWGDYATFDAHGGGLVLIMDGAIACAAYMSGASATQANVSIVTAEAQRGRGLATVTCSALIERLLERGIQPTWCTDAINTASGRLAEKLGFVEDAPYLQVGPRWGEQLARTEGGWQAAAADAEGVVPLTQVSR